MTKYNCLGYRLIKTKKGQDCFVVYAGYKDKLTSGIACDTVFVDPAVVTGGELKVGSNFFLSYKRNSTFVDELAIVE